LHPVVAPLQNGYGGIVRTPTDKAVNPLVRDANLLGNLGLTEWVIPQVLAEVVFYFV
jgi:hypothetical protein